MLKIESHLIIFTSIISNSSDCYNQKIKNGREIFLQFSQLILTLQFVVTPEFYVVHLFNQESYLLKR